MDEDVTMDDMSADRNVIADLLERINKLDIRTDIDDELGKILDALIEYVNDNEAGMFADNYTCNYFFQVAVLLQALVIVYVKKVDALWDNTMEHHIRLSSSAELQEGPSVRSKMIERVKKRKQKAADNTEATGSILVIMDAYVNFLIKLDLVMDANNEIPCDYILGQKWKAIKRILVESDKLDENANELDDNPPVEEPLDRPSIGLSPEYTVYDSHDHKRISTFNLFQINWWLRYVIRLIGKLWVTNGGGVVGRSDFGVIEDIRASCLNRPVVVNLTRLPQKVLDSHQENNASLVSTLHFEANLSVSECPNVQNVSELQNEKSMNSLQYDQGLNDTTDHGYNSAQSQLFSDIESIYPQTYNDDSDILCSQRTTNTIMEVDENQNSVNIAESNMFPEENESDSESRTINVGFGETLQMCRMPALNSSEFFSPLLSSTPRKILYVKLEQLSRKRLSALRQPKLKRLAPCKLLTTIVTLHKIFEEFYNENYVPGDGECALQHWTDDSSSSDEDAAGLEANPIHAQVEPDIIHAEVEPDIILAQVEPDIPELRGDLLVDMFENPIPADEAIIPVENAMAECEQVTIQEMEPNIFPELLKVQQSFEWQGFILPIIQKAENQSKFHIHEYGTKILEAIPENKIVAFKDLVEGKVQEEVVRYFLAALQLANTYNVEPVNTCPGKLANDSFALKWLSKDRHHEHLDEFKAPSETTLAQKLSSARQSLLRDIVVMTNRLATSDYHSSQPSTSGSQPSTSSGYQTQRLTSQSNASRPSTSGSRPLSSWCYPRQPSTSGSESSKSGGYSSPQSSSSGYLSQPSTSGIYLSRPSTSRGYSSEASAYSGYPRQSLTSGSQPSTSRRNPSQPSTSGSYHTQPSTSQGQSITELEHSPDHFRQKTGKGKRPRFT